MEIPRDETQFHRFEDWREKFEPQAQRARKKHATAGCLGLLAVMAVFLSLLFLSGENTFPWYWAFIGFGAAVFILVQLRPAPWPNCPACSGSFRRLGRFCPHCGSDLPPEAKPKAGTCSQCGYRMFIASKAPCYHALTKERPTRLVPVRYCTHCGAQLAS